jgi:hypothetical protein
LPAGSLSFFTIGFGNEVITAGGVFGAASISCIDFVFTGTGCLTSGVLASVEAGFTTAGPCAVITFGFADSFSSFRSVVAGFGIILFGVALTDTGVFDSAVIVLAGFTAGAAAFLAMGGFASSIFADCAEEVKFIEAKIAVTVKLKNTFFILLFLKMLIFIV